MMRCEDGSLVDGVISKINIGGKTYALQCCVIEARPITCKKCGHPFELAYGKGKCEFCGTSYTTEFVVQEDS